MVSVTISGSPAGALSLIFNFIQPPAKDGRSGGQSI
jgi:hypothetical protein